MLDTVFFRLLVLLGLAGEGVGVMVGSGEEEVLLVKLCFLTKEAEARDFLVALTGSKMVFMAAFNEEERRARAGTAGISSLPPVCATACTLHTSVSEH